MGLGNGATVGDPPYAGLFPNRRGTSEDEVILGPMRHIEANLHAKRAAHKQQLEELLTKHGITQTTVSYINLTGGHHASTITLVGPESKQILESGILPTFCAEIKTREGLDLKMTAASIKENPDLSKTTLHVSLRDTRQQRVEPASR